MKADQNRYGGAGLFSCPVRTLHLKADHKVLGGVKFPAGPLRALRGSCTASPLAPHSLFKARAFNREGCGKASLSPSPQRSGWLRKLSFGPLGLAIVDLGAAPARSGIVLWALVMVLVYFGAAPARSGRVLLAFGMVLVDLGAAPARSSPPRGIPLFFEHSRPPFCGLTHCHAY